MAPHLKSHNVVGELDYVFIYKLLSKLLSDAVLVGFVGRTNRKAA